MQTDAFNHAPAQIFMNTGAQQFGRPSMGAWATYGLGSEVAGPAGLRRLQHRPEGHQRRRGELGLRLPADRLPGRAVPRRRAIRSSTSPTRRGVDRHDAARHARRDPQPERAAPRRGRRPRDRDAHQLLRDGLPHAVERAGADGPLARSRRRRSRCTAPSRASRRYANSCLLARRLVERGVRFVQIFHEAWDHHGGLVGGLKDQCKKTDQASAALVKDLKQRGLLDDTLVIWGGEFGRTPMVQGGNDGRDHHPNAFTMWLAGGGMKPGIDARRDRRVRLQRRRGQGPRPRPARHDPAPARLRPHEADLPLPGPRLPPDRRPRRGREEAAGVSRTERPGPSPAAQPGQLGILAAQNVLGWLLVREKVGCEFTCR